MSSDGRRCFTFIWRIENFSFCSQKTGEYFSSPSFLAGTSSWHLDLYPRGTLDETIMVCFLRHDGTYSEREIACEFSVLTANGDHGISKELHGESVSLEIFRDHLLRTKTIFWPQDTLTIRIRIFNIELEESSLCQATTRVGIERTRFMWAIKPFSALVPNEDSFFALPSYSEESSPVRMSFALSSNETVRIGIINNTDSCKFLTCKLSVVPKNKCITFSKTDEYFLYRKQEWNFPLFFLVSQLTARKGLYLPYDTLSIRCYLAISEGVEIGHVEASIYGDLALETFNKTWTESKGTLKDDLYHSFVKGKYSDAILCAVDDVKFRAHSAVLRFRSPVFRAILYKRGGGGGTTSVIRTGLGSETLCRLLVFMYTDTTVGLEFEDALKLYSTAHKYQIRSLMMHCSSVLKPLLAVSNVDRVLDFSDEHRDHELKTAALSFILAHRRELHASKEWLQILQLKPDLVAETMWAISNNGEIDETTKQR